jgi:WD40 repeat protein
MRVDTVSYPENMDFAKEAPIACGEIDSYTKKVAVINWQNQSIKIFIGQNPSISPDGNKILMSKEYKKTYLVMVKDPVNAKIIDEDRMVSSSWSPDGKYIAYVVTTKDYKIFLRITDNEGKLIVNHKLSTYIDNINWGFDNYIYFNAGNSTDGYTCNRVKFNAK